MLLWCSIMETSTSSPLPRLFKPQEYATKLMASVVPRTKMTSLVDLALMNLATAFACFLVEIGCFRAKRVDASVDVTVVVL